MPKKRVQWISIDVLNPARSQSSVDVDDTIDAVRHHMRIAVAKVFTALAPGVLKVVSSENQDCTLKKGIYPLAQPRHYLQTTIKCFTVPVCAGPD